MPSKGAAHGSSSVAQAVVGALHLSACGKDIVDTWQCTVHTLVAALLDASRGQPGKTCVEATSKSCSTCTSTKLASWHASTLCTFQWAKRPCVLAVPVPLRSAEARQLLKVCGCWGARQYPLHYGSTGLLCPSHCPPAGKPWLGQALAPAGGGSSARCWPGRHPDCRALIPHDQGSGEPKHIRERAGGAYSTLDAS